MLIIIEGPDLAGKTTLAGRVADELNRRYPQDKTTVIHKGPPTQHPLDEYERPFWGYRPGRGAHVVCDRLHWGEYVYPQVFGRDTQLTREVWAHLELFLASRGAFVVHVTASSTEIRKRLEKRGDDLVNESQAILARDRFYDADRYSILPRIMSENVMHADVPGTVVDLAETHERMCLSLNPYTTYIGRPQPELFLVGDVRGGSPSLHGLGPAFLPLNGNSGTYLLRTVTSRPWAHLGIANACDVDNVRELWESLGKPETVALGKNAHNTITWKHREAPHPQWVRRFHHGERYQYTRQLLLGEEPRWNRVCRTCAPATSSSSSSLPPVASRSVRAVS